MGKRSHAGKVILKKEGGGELTLYSCKSGAVSLPEERPNYRAIFKDIEQGWVEIKSEKKGRIKPDIFIARFVMSAKWQLK